MYCHNYTPNLYLGAYHTCYGTSGCKESLGTIIRKMLLAVHAARDQRICLFMLYLCTRKSTQTSTHWQTHIARKSAMALAHVAVDFMTYRNQRGILL